MLYARLGRIEAHKQLGCDPSAFAQVAGYVGHMSGMLGMGEPDGGTPAPGPQRSLEVIAFGKITGQLGLSWPNMERMSDQPGRWSRATVHPDMWADPDDDPRNSEGVSSDGELATLRDFLADYRMTLRMKCEGLDAEQLARRSVPPSTMSLLGLLRHLAEVERDWRNWISDGDPLVKLYGEKDADFDGAVAEQAEVDAAYSALDCEQAETDAALARHPDLSERLGKDGTSVRELMVHRIEEYARHCGHADLLRERIDGRVGQ